MPKDKTPAASASTTAATASAPGDKRRKPRQPPGASGPRKRKEVEKTSDTLQTGKNLTLREWLEVIDFTESNPAMTQSQVEHHFRAKGYKVSQSMLSKKLKAKDELRARALATGNALDSKRPRVVTSPEVERALVLWFQGMEARGEIVSGGMLVEKRARFEEALGIPKEQRLTGDGWIKGFKNAYGIKEHRRHGEAGSVDPAAADSERERLRPILAKYAPEDQFNGDEGALFAYQPPDRGLSTKAMSGKKANKFRITLLFVCNSTGTEKEPLMYIGKSENPRCFKQIPASKKKKFYYRWNKKAWMNARLFEEWVKYFDRKMRLQGRHVLLLLDNFTGHKIAYSPTNVDIRFLAPNMTSRIQPLDAGIIRAFKAHYRRAFCQRALDADEAGDDDIWKLNLWEAINMARDAWDEISAETIRNCWAHTGILPLPAVDVPAQQLPSATATADAGPPDSHDTAWTFIFDFANDETMSLPVAETRLAELLGPAAAAPAWQKALGIANDVEPGDEASQLAARKALEALRDGSRPTPALPASTTAASPALARPPDQASATTGPLSSPAEADLSKQIKQLVTRKLIRHPLSVDEFLEPAEEQLIGEGVHELETDEEIIAMVHAESAAKEAAPAGDAESDDEPENDNPATQLSIDAIVELCTQLEAACIARGVDNAPQLRTELQKVKRELRQTELKTAKQLSIEQFLGQGKVQDDMDVDIIA